jgi:hypothetical protein
MDAVPSGPCSEGLCEFIGQRGIAGGNSAVDRHDEPTGSARSDD